MWNFYEFSNKLHNEKQIDEGMDFETFKKLGVPRMDQKVADEMGVGDETPAKTQPITSGNPRQRLSTSRASGRQGRSKLSGQKKMSPEQLNNMQMAYDKKRFAFITNPKELDKWMAANNVSWTNPDTGKEQTIYDYMVNQKGPSPYFSVDHNEKEIEGGRKAIYVGNMKQALSAMDKAHLPKNYVDRSDSKAFFDPKKGTRMGRRVSAEKKYIPLEDRIGDEANKIINTLAASPRLKKGKFYSVAALAREASRDLLRGGKESEMPSENIEQIIKDIIKMDRGMRKEIIVDGKRKYDRVQYPIYDARSPQIVTDSEGNEKLKTINRSDKIDVDSIPSDQLKVKYNFENRNYDPTKEADVKSQTPSYALNPKNPALPDLPEHQEWMDYCMLMENFGI